jgi:hypothetical protein
MVVIVMSVRVSVPSVAVTTMRPPLWAFPPTTMPVSVPTVAVPTMAMSC